MTGVCWHCGRREDRTLNERHKFTVELRPYGPGGATVCFECATAPERADETRRNFATQLDAAVAVSPLGSAVIGHGHDRGPDALVPDEEGAT